MVKNKFNGFGKKPTIESFLHGGSESYTFKTAKTTVNIFFAENKNSTTIEHALAKIAQRENIRKIGKEYTKA